MHPTIKALGIDQMSVAERIILVEEIWDSIASESENVEIPSWHIEELDRRLANHEANRSSGSSWKDVKARLLGEP